MKVFVVMAVLSLIAVSCAEPQRRKNSRYRSRFLARQEAAEEAASAPYPPSGWKPDGETFDLPAPTSQPTQEYGPPNNDQFEVPNQEIGQPINEYGPPENQFAPPEELEQEEDEEEQQVDDSDIEPESETFAPLADEESGRYRSRYVSRSRQLSRSQKLRVLPQKYRKAPAQLRKRF